MKKLYITLIIIVLGIVGFAQNDYYWSASIKHYLKEVPGVFIVKFVGEEEFEVEKTNLLNKQDIKYVSLIKDDIGFIVERESFALTSEKLKTYDELENAMPAHEFGNLTFFLTGEILLQPKLDIPITKILEFINNEASVKQKTKYNTFVLETNR